MPIEDHDVCAWTLGTSSLGLPVIDPLVLDIFFAEHHTRIPSLQESRRDFGMHKFAQCLAQTSQTHALLSGECAFFADSRCLLIGAYFASVWLHAVTVPPLSSRVSLPEEPSSSSLPRRCNQRRINAGVAHPASL